MATQATSTPIAEFTGRICDFLPTVVKTVEGWTNQGIEKLKNGYLVDKPKVFETAQGVSNFIKARGHIILAVGIAITAWYSLSALAIGVGIGCAVTLITKNKDICENNQMRALVGLAMIVDQMFYKLFPTIGFGILVGNTVANLSCIQKLSFLKAMQSTTAQPAAAADAVQEILQRKVPECAATGASSAAATAADSNTPV